MKIIDDKFYTITLCLEFYLQCRGWIKEVKVHAELRGTLVREIAIAIAYIYLWSVPSYNNRSVSFHMVNRCYLCLHRTLC